MHVHFHNQSSIRSCESNYLETLIKCCIGSGSQKELVIQLFMISLLTSMAHDDGRRCDNKRLKYIMLDVLWGKTWCLDNDS